ncbi:SH3 domain-containing protein [Streptomyces sp. NPDC058470]|uniref:SH3 domain-containing protein n=1 Tax=unclassified Streptomyces TaxID=2593676 RepID=UPI002E2860FF|nr:SH3 domain-containing protein [Streptomyces sp. NBC_00239]
MAALKRFATVALSVSLLAGGAAALAPTASAASSDCSTYDQSAEVDGNGINFRSGPSTSYKSKGLVYNADQLALYCKSGSWYKAKLKKRSKGGLPAGTYGWIRQDMIKFHLAG